MNISLPAITGTSLAYRLHVLTVMYLIPGHIKMVRKIKSTKEVLDTMRGVIDTPEKFEQLRMEIATRVWESMKAIDSRECRGCHNVDAMALAAQNDITKERHQKCVSGDKTCIDCHKKALPTNYRKSFSNRSMSALLKKMRPVSTATLTWIFKR